MRREVVAGVSLALSGELRLQGREAARGLRLWCACVGEGGGLDLGPATPRLPLRLVVLDDEGRITRAAENTRILLTRDRVDLLVGPYGSHLMRAVARLAEAQGRVVWNHGGASDAIVEQGLRNVVSVPSPASEYFRDLPALVRRRDATVRRLAIVHSSRGDFAAEVARGVAEAARAERFDVIRTVAFAPPLSDAERPLGEALEAEPQLIVGVGGFRDDVKLASQRALLGRGRVLAFVGAGLDAFYRAIGDGADGVIGPSQWEPGIGDPPRTGPDAGWFCAAYDRRFGSRPGYPAAQAFAIGVILQECVRTAQSLDDRALLDAARALETTTLYGGFRLDPATARQIGHRMLLVQWRAGRKEILSGGAPPGVE